MSFTFGNTTPKSTTGVTFGSLAQTTTTASGFSLGAPAATGGLSFGTPSNLANTPGFALGGGDVTNKPSTVQTAAVKPIAATAPLSTSFSLGGTPTTAAATTTTALATPAFPSFSLAAGTTAASATIATPSFSFGATSTPATAATAAPAFSLTPATTATSALKLGGTSLALTTTTTTPASGIGTALTSTTPASTTLGATPAGITFVQLEETIDKWKLELEEQEKIFMSQAAQINYWDNLLNSNSEKIVALNNDVSAMKLQQQQLDHELDFIVAQQRELEEVLLPLEKQAAEIPSNTDPEREHTYHMAETLDTQLKQMCDDLKEIIENINESSRTQDTSDPIVQVGRILNAHMNSLHWIDQMTLNIQNQLENVTKLHDIHRRENERSFRISYE